jgi:hypothetical protein
LTSNSKAANAIHRERVAADVREILEDFPRAE